MTTEYSAMIMGDGECTTVLENFSDHLEFLVDLHGIVDVTEKLREICHDKAEHIRVNWQDEDTADAWEEAGNLIDTAYQGMQGGG